MQEIKLRSAEGPRGGKQFYPNLLLSMEGNYSFVIEGMGSRKEAPQQRKVSADLSVVSLDLPTPEMMDLLLEWNPHTHLTEKH